MPELFACGVDFRANPLVGTVGEHQELRVLAGKMRHVVLTVEPVVGHDDRRRQIEHVKLPKRIGERDLVRDVPGLLAESDGLTIVCYQCVCNPDLRCFGSWSLGISQHCRSIG